MCQDKNEVINYYWYINIRGQVRVRLVIKIGSVMRGKTRHLRISLVIKKA